MKKILKKISAYACVCLLFGTLVIPSSLNSQSIDNIRFGKLALPDLYNNIQINGITKDGLGNIWYINNAGLHKYDGAKLTTFSTVNCTNKKYSLYGVLRHVQADSTFVYAMSRKEVFYFNIKTEVFKRFEIANCNDIKVSNETLWIATSNKILNLKTNQYLPIKLNKGEAFTKIQPSKGMFYIATNKRMLAYSVEHKKLIALKDNVQVEALFVDSKKNVWFSDKGKGIYKYKLDKLFTFFDSEKITPTEVRCFVEDNNNNIWIGTYGGVYIISPQSKITHYTNDDNISGGLSHNSVLSMYKDSNGLILIGTFFGGLNYYNPNNLFTHYQEAINQKDGLNFKVVSEIVEDNKGNLWICTEGGGLNCLDKQQNKMNYYEPPALENGMVYNSFKAIYYDQKETLWIASIGGGLFEFNIKNKKFYNYAHKNNNNLAISSNKINDIVTYKEQLFLSTQSSVEVFDLKTKTVKPLFTHTFKIEHKIPNYITCLLVKDDVLWMGSTIGLFAYNLKTKTVNRYQENTINSIASNNVNDLFEDSKGRIWVATGKGLNRFDDNQQQFTTYKNTQEQSRNIIKGVEELNPGFLVVSSIKGISVLRMLDGKFKNYDQSTGFPLHVLSNKSIYVSPTKNQVFIGGLDGMVSFSSNEIFKPFTLLKPVLTKLKINNQEIKPNDNEEILQKTFALTDTIILRPEHKSLQISFSSNSDKITQKGNFKVRLLGFESDWIEPETTTVSYTNLDVGDYVFEIENIDNSTLRRILYIKVIPSIFNTVWAYFLYFLIALLILLFFNYLILAKKRLQDKVKLKEIEQEKNAEHNKSKLRFFTNISHEFRTPLTLISGHVEGLMGSNEITSNDYKKVLGINKNTNRLNRLALELLQFRKQEAGEYKIEAREHDIVSFLEEIYYSFFELSSRKRINYTMICTTKPINVWFDSLQLEKVFYNLLSNAFKFTKDGGKIEVSIISNNTSVSIQVKDTGNGMSSEQLSKIFDRFHQLENIASTIHIGTGIGLALTKGIIDAHHGKINVESKLNHGTTFTVDLLLGNNHFNPKEIILEKAPTPVVAYESYENLGVKEMQTNNEKKETLLVVEDNSEVRQMLKGFLDFNFDVQLAKDGKEGMEQALKLQPTLILSDIMMPNMSGTEMCTKLKTNVNTSHIPIILLTAKTAEEHMISGLDIGADDYITKPFNSRVLIARINNIINSRKRLKSIFSKNPSDTIKKIAKNKIDQEFINKAEKAVLDNLDNNLYDVSKMGLDLNLGRTILYAKMKSITGKTPNDFIKVIRLEKSKKLLNEHPDITISQVAYDCGFSSQQYFSKLFKKQYGVSPKKFQNK